MKYMIFHRFRRSSPLEIKYIRSPFIYSLAFFTYDWYIMHSQCEQLPLGLITQFVGHSTGIAEVIVSNPA